MEPLTTTRLVLALHLVDKQVLQECPGSSTRTNSISLDAIQEIKTNIAPYDVKIGNFTGGSINAITRSGSNEVTGSVYGFGRNASLTGNNRANDYSKMPSSYYDYQTGFRVGLPLIKDKLFFFTNEEITRSQTPVFYGANSPGSLISDTTAAHIAQVAKTKYGFDVGAYDNYNITSQSNKFFNRIDWNISPKHQLSLRNNYIVSQASNLERDAQNFRFGSMDYMQHNVQNSTVMELKSRFTNSLANSLILGYSNIHDYRDPMANGNLRMPQVQINLAGGGTVYFGNDREAAVFNMKQKTFEITDNLSLV